MLNIPTDVGVDAIQILSHRMIPAPQRIDWEVIGSFHTVNSAILSIPDGVKVGWDESPLCTGTGKTKPPFAIERVAPSRPIANVPLDRVMDLVRGLLPIHDRLFFPSLYFGPLIWPSTSVAPQPILWNFVRISRRRQEWQTELGIWQESDGDPTVKDVRRHLVPILKAIRPTEYMKAGLGTSSD